MSTDERKLELQKLNKQAWEREHVEEHVFSSLASGKLDTSLKKNSAFIKKLKQSISKENVSDLLKDIASLSLEKYIVEIISALSESLARCTKNDDIAASIEVISALHQRFVLKFTPLLQAQILSAFEMPAPKNFEYFDDNLIQTKTDITRVSQQKNYLKIFMEFYLVGLFDVLDDNILELYPQFVVQNFSRLHRDFSSDVLLLVLKEILNFEIRFGSNIPIIFSFLKRYSNLFDLQVISKENNLDPQSNATEKLLELDTQKYVYELLLSYGKLFKKYTLKMHQMLFRLRVKIKQVRIKTGRINEDLDKSFELRQEFFKKYKDLCDLLTSTIGLEPLVLPDLEKEFEALTKEGDEEEGFNSTVSSADKLKSNPNMSSNGVIIWESDEEKLFYCNVPDMSLRLPKSVLESATSKANVFSDKGEEMSKFLKKLLECKSQKKIDDLAEEYWIRGLNNKASRNRLYKTFLENGELGQMKYFARFLALNSKLLPKLITALIEKLDSSFRFQIFSNEAVRMNVKNIYFFTELIKFNLVESHIVYHKIRSMILKIKQTNNVDMLNVYFGQCGRFLYYGNGPESKVLMEEMLQLLKEKRAEDKSLTLNDKMAIDNLLLTIIPPSVKSINEQRKFYGKEQRTSEQEFILMLIHKELNERTWPEITILIIKLNLKTYENFEFLKYLFTRPEDLTYENIKYLALMVFWLRELSEPLFVYVIDSVLEKIQRGLEVPNYKYNRVRTAHIRYLSELLAVGIDSNKGSTKENDKKDLQQYISIFFSTLSKVLNFGYFGVPVMEFNNTLDVDNNYFRISLIIIYLEIFNKSNFFDESVKALADAANTEDTATVDESVKLRFIDHYKKTLLYFNYYILIKRQPLPKDIKFRVNALFDSLKPIYTYNGNLSEIMVLLRFSLTGQAQVPSASVDNVPQPGINTVDDVQAEDTRLPETKANRLPKPKFKMLKPKPGKHAPSNTYESTSQVPVPALIPVSSAVPDEEADASFDENLQENLRLEQERKLEQEIDFQLNRMIMQSLESRQQVEFSGYAEVVPSKKETSSKVLASNASHPSELYTRSSGSSNATKPQGTLKLKVSPSNSANKVSPDVASVKSSNGGENGSTPGTGGNKVAFSLMTKSINGKNLVRKIQISTDEKIALEKLKQQEMKKQEQAQLKKIILRSINDNGSDYDDDDIMFDFKSPPSKRDKLGNDT